MTENQRKEISLSVYLKVLHDNNPCSGGVIWPDVKHWSLVLTWCEFTHSLHILYTSPKKSYSPDSTSEPKHPGPLRFSGWAKKKAKVILRTVMLNTPTRSVSCESFLASLLSRDASQIKLCIRIFQKPYIQKYFLVYNLGKTVTQNRAFEWVWRLHKRF